MKTFRVYSRSAASAIIRKNESIDVNSILDGVPIKLVLQTRYVDGYSSPAPAGMLILAEGEASDCKSAIEKFAGIAQELLAIVALSSNAMMGDIEPEIAFGPRSNSLKREFFQRFVPDIGLSLTSRFIDVAATTEMIGALYSSSEKGRLIRGIAQYRQALGYWRNGNELLALSHLFMGVEAMKTACWRHKRQKENKTNEDLGAEWGFREEGRMSLMESLDAAAREYLVFQGDADTLKIAKKTSDDFEHGSQDLGLLRPKARESAVATAKYLREAVIEVLDLQRKTRDLLIGERFAAPRGPLGTESYIFGNLTCEEQDLFSDILDFPHLEWKQGITDVEFDDSSQRYQFRPDNKIMGRFGPSAKLESIRMQLWDASSFLPVQKKRLKANLDNLSEFESTLILNSELLMAGFARFTEGGEGRLERAGIRPVGSGRQQGRARRPACAFRDETGPPLSRRRRSAYN